VSFTVAAVVVIAAFGLLSQWQFDRAAEENAKANSVAAFATADPVPLQSLLQPGEPLPDGQEWRPVTATGELACEQGYLVRNRPLSATNGYWAACPLRTTDGSWLWVNRGWLPAPGPAIEVVPMPLAPVGEVVVTGWLRASESGPEVPPGDLPQGQASHLDTDVLSSVAGLPGGAYEPYVVATALSPVDPGQLQQLPLPESDSAQNYSYAGQWLLFATVVVGGWFFFLRREAIDEAEAQDHPAPQPTG